MRLSLAVGVVQPQVERVAGAHRKNVVIDVVAVGEIYGRSTLYDGPSGHEFLAGLFDRFALALDRGGKDILDVDVRDRLAAGHGHLAADCSDDRLGGRGWGAPGLGAGRCAGHRTGRRRRRFGLGRCGRRRRRLCHRRKVLEGLGQQRRPLPIEFGGLADRGPKRCELGVQLTYFTPEILDLARLRRPTHPGTHEQHGYDRCNQRRCGLRFAHGLPPLVRREWAIRSNNNRAPGNSGAQTRKDRTRTRSSWCW